jgi:hypothetical protein
MLQSKLSAVKLSASDLQAFLGGRTILREVEEEELYVTTLLEEKCIQQVNLCYRPEAKMVAINNIESISLWIFCRWSVIFVRFSSLSRITLSMLLEMSFKVSSILSSIAEVLAVLTMFSIANNPTHSLWSSDIHSGQHKNK